MKVLKGHLTQRDKKIIRIMLTEGMTSGKSGRKSFLLTKQDDLYTAKIHSRERHCIGADLKDTIHTHTFKL